ncbi:MAG: Helix-turn-helix domain protein [Firmicutes bacterium ADurb.Bin373]|nr:MAG: Helix-turn-helix domain protein [Firmicutes bacterium ADurb.Bin373]
MAFKPGVEGLRLYTVPEVAGILRVKKGYVYELIYTGRLQAIKLSERRIRITNDQLMQYLEQETQGRAEN